MEIRLQESTQDPANHLRIKVSKLKLPLHCVKFVQYGDDKLYMPRPFSEFDFARSGDSIAKEYIMIICMNHDHMNYNCYLNTSTPDNL